MKKFLAFILIACFCINCWNVHVFAGKLARRHKKRYVQTARLVAPQVILPCVVQLTNANIYPANGTCNGEALGFSYDASCGSGNTSGCQPLYAKFVICLLDSNCGQTVYSTSGCGNIVPALNCGETLPGNGNMCYSPPWNNPGPWGNYKVYVQVYTDSACAGGTPVYTFSAYMAWVPGLPGAYGTWKIIGNPCS